MNATAAAPTVYRLEIPGLHPPSLNRLMRGKLRTRMRLERKWSEQVARARLAFAIPRASYRRRVTLHIILDKAERGCDVDAYWKATLDALVRCGLLRHDSPGWAEITPVIYSREPGQKRTIIELEDIT